MNDRERIFENDDPEFEESIRVDRELKTDDPEEQREQLYNRYLDNYHLTDASIDVLVELFTHIHDDNPAPDELNHWLYGYYGSGKSHLLSALNLLLDTQNLDQTKMEAVWRRFDSQNDEPELGDSWRSLHDDALVVPLTINLLKYQGVREQSFSEIILQTVYQKRGFAEQLDVAFFEEEFQRSGGLYDTQEVWENRNQLLNDILREEGVQNPDYEWDDVRRYRILSDIVLEGLTERATGMTENLDDIQNRNIGQKLAVNAIESYRQELQTQTDRPVKIILLMDEVTLFIGGKYSRLSELNALAESIADVGQGNILSVVTAQTNIEDAQPGYSAKELDFEILKDRFPQQYELPSRHVGEIVQRRLLEKSHQGREWIENEALTATVHPQTMLVYREITQNTEPPLDEIDEEQFINYYPLLPYQPALFMEILSNLRDELADATKSIFSGTARAILSIVSGLREVWVEKDGDKPIISLVDFYNLVEYELEDIIPEKTTVIEDISHDPATTEFDLKVAKAVLLLSYVPDLVPQSDANLATAIMDDLEGQTRANLQTRVRESLEGNLEKYIRPDTSTDGNNLRLTDREEQQLISRAHELQADPDWGRVINKLDDQLWDEIIAELDPPQTYDYVTEDGEATPYPVEYNYRIDGEPLESGKTEDAVYEVDVFVRGLRPDVDDTDIDPKTLYWFIEPEGLDELRVQIERWWALIEATQSTNPPESLVRDRRDAANRVVNKLTAALSNGIYRVEASKFDSFETARDDYIDEAYPPYFHPELSRIGDSHLDELKQLEDGGDLPKWAHSIGVPEQSTDDFATFSDIAFKVRQLVGKEVQNAGVELDVATILDRVCEREPLFARETEDGETEPSPATLAVLWGLCRAGVFQLTTIEGEPIPIKKLLFQSNHTSLTLTPVPPGKRPKDVFVEYDIIEPTESGNKGYVEFNNLLDDLESRASALHDEVTVQAENSFNSEAITPLIEHFAVEIREIAESAEKRQNRATTKDAEELCEMVEMAQAGESVLETAELRWSERLPFLIQLEGIVQLTAVEIEWLDAEAEKQITTLTEQIESIEDIDWWTDDGWSTFVGNLDARHDTVTAICEAWENQRTATDLSTLTDSLDEHPWLVDLMDLPTHKIHERFRLEYLDPLRNFRTTVNRIKTVVKPLTDPEPGKDDKQKLMQALRLLDNDIDWGVMTKSTVAERREQLATLDRVVGDAEPDDLVGIGVLHDDADALRSQIKALDLDDGVPELVEVDEGVIIK